MKQVLTVGCLLWGGCAGQGGSGQSAVSQANSLGIVALDIERSTTPDGDAFSLRGLDADENEVASVRLRVGTISDLPDLLPGPDATGSEIVVALDDGSVRLVSRATQFFTIGPFDPRMQSFLDLKDVAANLKQAHIVVAPTNTVGEATYSTNTQQCPPNFLLSSPVADGCCTDVNNGTQQNTLFIRPSDGKVISRLRNVAGNGAGCKDSSGTGSCAGAACVYGPAGFAQPSVISGTGYAAILIQGLTGQQHCSQRWTPTKQSSSWGNVTGTFPRGQGCPGGTSGGNGLWDY